MYLLILCLKNKSSAGLCVLCSSVHKKYSVLIKNRSMYVLCKNGYVGLFFYRKLIYFVVTYNYNVTKYEIPLCRTG